MKLPITDKFLWKVFELLQKANKAYDLFAVRTWKDVVYPELFEIRREFMRHKKQRQFSRLIYYLKRKGYIGIKNLEAAKGVMLTLKGVEEVMKIRLKITKKQRRSDGKWEMVIFDIPEKKKKLREIVRKILNEIGYSRLQDSVWVCPYDVEKETEFLLRDYMADPYIKVFLIEKMDIS